MKDITLGELLEIASKKNLVLQLDIRPMSDEVRFELFNQRTDFHMSKRFSTVFVHDAPGLQNYVLEYLKDMARRVSDEKSQLS